MDSLFKDLRAMNLEHLDFEWVMPDDPILPSLIPSSASADLFVFGKQASGSLMAVWRKTGADGSASPVVWIDSEGTPNVVIASNLPQFFALLPYGTGMIYDLAYGLAHFLENRKSNKRYLKRFTPKYLAMRRAEAESESQTKELADWLTNNWQISLTENPLVNMQTAMENEADFNVWLQTKR